MEEDKGAAGASSRVSASLAPLAPPAPQPSSSSNPSKESIASAKRQMFSVELKPGETTIVSWKKLLKEGGKGSAKPPDLTGADPVSASGAGPAAAAVQPFEGELQDGQPSNRFSSVIEKIERLYMGKQSSDEEELDDIPDDDQYDTEDSFIDDAELDEYFQVDKLSTKHNGYFVNRGKLEKIEPSSSPNLTPKKRRRKDATKVNTEANHKHVTNDPVTTGNVRIKAAARSAPLMGKKLPSLAKIQTAYGEHYHEGNFLKNKTNASSGSYKKRSADSIRENTLSGRISKDVSSLSLESKDVDKQNVAVLPSKDLTHKSRLINESVDGIHHVSRDKTACSQFESHSRKSLNCENEAEIYAKVRRKERYGTDGYPNMDSAAGAYSMQATQPTSTRVKDGSSIRPKGTTLERAICDLEKIVASCRPPKVDFQEVDTSSQGQGVKRRLPQEVKQKLAKVARLSASQNKISEDDLIDRLMGTVGHIVQRKTLKRNMREMVELGLSAKQEKSGRFQQIKQEVNEMINTRVSLLKSKVAEQHDGSVDDFQEVNGNDERAVRKYGMGSALEDKICDLYDLYVEGMDEDKGPQSRKLYVSLAELWPNGYMDSNGIKDAIFRSKERKRSRIYRHKVRDEERIKRKKLAAAARVEGTSLGSQVQSGLERPATDSTAQVLAPPEKVTTNQPVALSGRLLEPATPSSDPGHQHVSKHHDKARLSSSTCVVLDNGSKTAVGGVKKKRKPEADLGEIHVHPTKLPLQHGKERSSSQKQSDDSSSLLQPKPNLQLQVPGAPVPSDQHS